MPHPATPKLNPDVLAWARQEGGFPVERVARRLGVPVERVAAWEIGEKSPTLRQTMDLARLFQRPLNLFFAPSPPRTSPVSAEYRRLRDVDPGSESVEMRFAIRRMVERRETALSLLEELGEEIVTFDLSAQLGDRPESVGALLRAASGLPIDAARDWKDGRAAWRAWREAIESLGVLVFMFPDVRLEEARGLALPQDPLPIVAVNTKEIPEARAFTAIHELIHLMLIRGGEEGVAQDDRRSTEDLIRLERFVERTASYVLVPEEALLAEITEGVPLDVEGMRTLARRFRITPSAMAARLRESARLSYLEYESWRGLWNEYIAGHPARPSGFSRPEDRTLGRSGRRFSRLVLEALDANRITSLEACRYLDLRFPSFDALRERLAPSGGDVEDE